MSAEKYLKDIIKQNGGKINISRFMSECLCNPKFGYYTNNNPFGDKGDFVTAPEISQIFGELIGVWCAYIWQQRNKANNNLMLVELGAGKGTLMLDLLRATANVSGFHKNIEIHIVEISPVLIDIQKQTLKDYPNIKWHNSIDKLPNKPLLLVANEFFDALPINQYVKENGCWYEKFVSINNNDNLCFLLEKNFISKKLDKTHCDIKDGSVYELSIAGDAIMKNICDKIKNNGGGALVIDYGYTVKNHENTLQAVKNHKYHDILENVAQADLTSHVDFEQLSEIVHDSKIMNSSILSQGEFLKMMGIEERANQLVGNAKSESQANEIISAKNRLIDIDKMGDLFKVLSLVN